MKQAVIGIGSNSIRMLVAEIEGNKGVRLLRDRAGTRLFAGLDANGCLTEEALCAAEDVVLGMAAKARALGAESVDLFATSATRDARNSDVLIRRLYEKGGLSLQVISGKEEASLSFQGATTGEMSGMIDIGGGSTEIVVGQGENLECAFSCQMGALRLFRMLPLASAADIPSVVNAAKDILETNLASAPAFSHPQTWVGVGGTFTTLAAIVHGVHWADRTLIHGTVVPLAKVRETAEMIADLSMEERLKLQGLQPNRADIVVHGLCILITAMERLEIPQIRVSEYGNLDGWLKRRWDLTGDISPKGPQK